ncbi:RNA helicase [Vibrio crassostreae]|nr:RNA helicase [Vibrio crassostreae]CAK1831595.1 RNA helicase [Vibrio crassostreae]CAK2302424.1 RNA helicase [Vibrio crassostreae]CAK2633872.1 RNA helicase [Vibrio crassostreae]CAK2658526.1 RNA helicase [Vibrio crassostreae]
MLPTNVADWMQSQLEKDGCLYQDDVVDMLIKSRLEKHLRENADGNQVLTRPVLNQFKKLNEHTVVWVGSGKYWRFRVKEDEPSRTARG